AASAVELIGRSLARVAPPSQVVPEPGRDPPGARAGYVPPSRSRRGPPPYDATWQAARLPLARRRSGGGSSKHARGLSATGHRGGKGQPAGGSVGLGRSPGRITRRRRRAGSRTGTAESRAIVYGWRGAR